MSAEPSIKVPIERHGNNVNAWIAGPINRLTIPGLQQRLDGVLRDRGISLRLDLGAAEYLDSDGIRWLQRLQAVLQSAGGELHLAVQHESRIHRTLCLLQLDRILGIDTYSPAQEREITGETRSLTPA